MFQLETEIEEIDRYIKVLRELKDRDYDKKFAERRDRALNNFKESKEK